eukprot:544409_1
MPTTSMPTTSIPTTSIPTTSMPTTLIPTTSMPTTLIPTTSMPTTLIPTTTDPTTDIPTTNPTNHGQAMESTSIEFTRNPIKSDDGFFFSLSMEYILIAIIVILCIVVIICGIILGYRRKQFHNKDTMFANMETEMTVKSVSSMSDVSKPMEGPKTSAPTDKNTNYGTDDLMNESDNKQTKKK